MHEIQHEETLLISSSDLLLQIHFFLKKERHCWHLALTQ